MCVKDHLTSDFIRKDNDEEVFVKMDNQKKFKMIKNRTSQAILNKLLVTYKDISLSYISCYSSENLKLINI